MKHINIHIKLFVIILAIGGICLPLLNKQYAFNGEQYEKKTLLITINGYSYTDTTDEVYLEIAVGDKKSGYTVYEDIFSEYFKLGTLNIGDFIKIRDDCLVNENGITYFESSNQDILNAFKKKYNLK